MTQLELMESMYIEQCILLIYTSHPHIGMGHSYRRGQISW